jgi:two-component system response regulator PilR (NtrC family)
MPETRILLVEDEPITNQLLANVLRGEGYVVDAAMTAGEGMAFLDRRSYALVITDWRLPDGDGLVIADAAKQLGATTFVMSGYLFQMPGGRADGHEALMKPIRPGELLLIVERNIGKARVA